MREAELDEGIILKGLDEDIAKWLRDKRYTRKWKSASNYANTIFRKLYNRERSAKRG
jgi:hypothetical protein